MFVCLQKLQLRFDGTIGFPGGFVDTEESLEDALRRELSEELGPGASTLDIEESNLVASHVHPDKPLCLHFYCKKIKMNEFIDIEKRSHEGAQHGLEVKFSFTSCNINETHKYLPRWRWMSIITCKM